MRKKIFSLWYIVRYFYLKFLACRSSMPWEMYKKKGKKWGGGAWRRFFTGSTYSGFGERIQLDGFLDFRRRYVDDTCLFYGVCAELTGIFDTSSGNGRTERAEVAQTNRGTVGQTAFDNSCILSPKPE